MKTKFKQSLAIFIAVLMFVSAIPFAAFASGTEADTTSEEYIANTKEGTWEGGTWKVATYNRALTISGEGALTREAVDNNSTETTFLEIVKKFNIVRIFMNASAITSIPDRFLYDEEGEVTSLRYIVLPNLTSIGEYAFANSSIEYVTNNFLKGSLNDNRINIDGKEYTVSYMPANIAYIGKYAFAECKIFGQYLITPAYLSNYKEGVFYNTAAELVLMGQDPKRVDKKAFGNCNNLTEMFITDTVNEFYDDDSNAADNCIGFSAEGALNENLTIHCRKNSGAYNYAKKHGIKTEESDKKARNGYFYAKSALSYKMDWDYNAQTDTVTLTPNGTLANNFRATKGISYYETTPIENATYDLLEGNKLVMYTSKEIKAGDCECTTLVIADGVKTIRADALFTPFDPEYIILPDSLQMLTGNVFRDCTRLKAIEIPNNVTDLDTKVFSNCPSLESVKIGNGVTVIPEKIFYNVKSLKFVELGNNVRLIKKNAFSDCTALQEIVIPDSVTDIETQAFYNCINAQRIYIGSNVKYVAPDAFSNSLYCEEIEINSDTINATTSGTYKPIFKEVGSYTEGVTVKYGDNVHTVDLKLLQGLNVNKIVLGKNVTTLVNNSLAPESLEEIEVDPQNVNFSVTNNVLMQGTTVMLAPKTAKTVTIPENATAIGDFAFYKSHLTAVSIPKNVKTIARYAFKDCEMLKSISIGKNVETIGESAFENDTQLRLAYIPENVRVIQSGAFRNCINLASVTFVFDTTKLKAIGYEAFYGCESIGGLVFPESLENIGERAFMDCDSLKYAYIWNAEIEECAFWHDRELTIYTMAGSDAYRYARESSIEYAAYTDENAFFDECAIKIDELAGYVGYCDNGHGDIQYLTVYEADCEHEGYVIGVCEYCSEILEEVHTPALGHEKELVADVPATEMTRGFTIEKCTRCGEEFCTHHEQTGDEAVIQTHTVKGKVTVAQNSNATASKAPVKDVKIVIDNMVMDTTDENGNFELTLETGVYEATLKYAFGFDRTVYIIVEDKDIICNPISMYACDFNKDGIIDDTDMKLFSMVISSGRDDVSYLRYVDLNNDGYINGRDQTYIRLCYGASVNNTNYSTVIIKK